MAAVALNCVTKVYPNGVAAVRELSLAVSEGELLVLMGPSGCGKTTILRLIAGLEQVTSGEVEIGGKQATHWPPHRRNVAMMFQRPALYPHLTVLDNLQFGVRMREGKRGIKPQEVQETARILQVEELLQRRPAELSGGQQQRVALGRAILRRPHAFLLDEPLSNLDERLRHELKQELHLLQRRLGATMLYVTHDPSEAMSLADRIAVLRQGRLEQAGPAPELYGRPANRFVAALLGTPAMNFLDGEVSGEGTAWWFGTADCRLALSSELAARWSAFRGRPLTLGVRPEILMVSRKADATSASLKMTVMLVEKPGDRTLATLRREPWTLTMSDRPDLPLREGEAVEIEIDMAKTHLFDRESGMALSHPGSG
jgi:ABC-type sugar transport system ATPase subunit